MDHWSDNCNKVDLCREVGSRNDVVVELLPWARLARVQAMTYRSGERNTALHQDFRPFSKEASIDSSIFDTGTPISWASAAPDS